MSYETETQRPDLETHNSRYLKLLTLSGGDFLTCWQNHTDPQRGERNQRRNPDKEIGLV